MNMKLHFVDDSDTTKPIMVIERQSGIAFGSMRPNYIIFGDGVIKINVETGEVTLKKGVPVDEAARLFWQAVEAAAPVCKRLEP